MKKDNAVSSVVGVMLMLSITVVLIAVVVVAATGVFAPSPKPITAEFSYVNTTNDGDFLFQMVGGEPFQMDRLRVTYSLKDYPKFHESPVLEGDTVNLGSRFFAGNLEEFKKNPNFPKSETKDLHLQLRFMFADKKTETLVSSGSIPITIKKA